MASAFDRGREAAQPPDALALPRSAPALLAIGQLLRLTTERGRMRLVQIATEPADAARVLYELGLGPRAPPPAARPFSPRQTSLPFAVSRREVLAREPQSLGWTALNERVYRERFLTPASDPWLGLAPTIRRATSRSAADPTRVVGEALYARGTREKS